MVAHSLTCDWFEARLEGVTGAMKDLGSGGNPPPQVECKGPAYCVLHKLK